MTRLAALTLALTLGSIPVAVTGNPAGERLRADITTLSSEGFQGRGPRTGGLELALEYLESRFRETGLEPAGDDGYRQAFAAPDGSWRVNLIGRVGPRDGDRHAVLGAHYDHLGTGEPGDANHGRIHPGADDNASGVAVLLEAARRLVEDPPRHPVFVIAFAGEEEGLLGSAHYAANPALPLASCTAMINLDTVGRLAGGPLTVFGTTLAPELPRAVRGVNLAFGFELELPAEDPGGSDQASFTGKGVPAIQLFTGAHPDYHRPGDTADKVDIDGLEALAGFTSELTLYLAERDEPLTFTPPGAEAAAKAAGPGTGGGRRVTFGSIPDFNDAGDGILLSGVIPGSPAEEAGLRTGDRIVEFAGIAVSDLRSFSDVLKTLSPGDETGVVYVRDGERREARVTVVERK